MRRVIKFGLAFTFFIIYCQVRAEQIVVIGDSHSCGDFGQRLVKNLAENGKNKVVMYCAGGLSTQHWLKGYNPPRSANKCYTYSDDNPKSKECLGTGELPPLEKILNGESKPNRVVVALGSNNLGMNALNSFAPFAKQIKKSGVSCHWIGPPALGANGEICRKHGHNLNKVIAAIESAAESICEYVDSREVTSPDSTPDCIHRYGKPARDWADGVSRMLNPQTNQGPSKSQIQGVK